MTKQELLEAAKKTAVAANTLAAAKDAKAKGTKYCICPACTNGAILLEHRHDLGC